MSGSDGLVSFGVLTLGSGDMSDQERIPREIERTLRPGDAWEMRGVDVIAIGVKWTAHHSGSVRIVATVIDKPPPNSYE